MPRYAFGRVVDALNKDRKAVNGSRVLMLGVSYKPNVGDLRESPCLEILRLLLESGAKAAYHDPHILPERNAPRVSSSARSKARSQRSSWHWPSYRVLLA